MALDEESPENVSETQKGWGVHLASYLGLDIINNVCESRDSLYRMNDDFRIRKPTWQNHTLTRLVILFGSPRNT